jgi:hypothetical protein
MTRNPFTDAEPFSVAVLNSMFNAHANEGVISGLDVTPGAGDFEVDVAGGEILLGYRSIDVAAGVDGRERQVRVIEVEREPGEGVVEFLERLLGADEQTALVVSESFLDELHRQRGLAGPGRPGQQVCPSGGKSSSKNLIESR